MIRKVGDWARARQATTALGPRFKRAVSKAMLKEAHFYRSKIIEGFRTGAPGGQKWKPLAPATIAGRKMKGFGGTKVGIVTGTMRNSTSVVQRNNEVFIGIKRSAKSADGESLVDIALVFTKGAIIVQNMSEQQRKFLGALMSKVGGNGGTGPSGSKGVLVIKIPARPIFEPIWEKYGGNKGAKRFYARVAAEMGGTLGLLGRGLLG